MRTAIRPLLPASAFTPRLAPPGIGSGKLRSVPSGCAICPPVLALHQSSLDRLDLRYMFPRIQGVSKDALICRPWLSAWITGVLC